MNERLNFRKSAVILMSLALLLGGFIYNIVLEIVDNGILFILPYLLFSLLGLSIVRIENSSLIAHEKNSLAAYMPQPFIKSFLSFNSISSLFLLAFFSFFEVFLSIEIVKFTILHLIKIINPDSLFTFNNPNLFVIVGCLCWILLVYSKLNADHVKSKWLNSFRILIFLIVLVFISLIFFQSNFLLDFIKTYLNDLKMEDRYYLKPVSIWNLKVWLHSAGKIFIVFIFIHFGYKIWVKHTSSFNSTIKLGLTSISLIFTAIGAVLVYLLPQIATRFQELEYLATDQIWIVLGAISLVVIILLFLLQSLTNIVFDIQRGSPIYDLLSFEESRILSKRNVLFVLITLLGLTSGILFIYVDFSAYFHWIGMLFLLLITLLFIIHFLNNFSFNKANKSFNNRDDSHELSSTEQLLLKFVIPILLVPILLISVPDIFSNFLGNKQLNRKIEDLQDLGKITSNHHSLEPYIIRDYTKVVSDIDSNKVILDKIDSLKPVQKDSIQLYLQNRNYKMNEDFRINKLQFYHHIVFVKNFSKWSLLLFVFLILILYRFKLRNS
jgi:hypothetical protein